MSTPLSMLTWRKTLLELLGLVRVLDDEGIEVAMAADLELGLRRASFAILLYPRRCIQDHVSACSFPSHLPSRPLRTPSAPVSFSEVFVEHVQEASLRRQISMKVLMSLISRGMLCDGLEVAIGDF